jgi:hypothetical protein
VNNSLAAMAYCNNNLPDLVVVDGHLKPSDDRYCNGPEFVQAILQKSPHLPIIAWTDSEFMREAFAVVFSQHNKLLNEYNLWNKVTGIERISKTWAYYFGGLIVGENVNHTYHPTRVAYC